MSAEAQAAWAALEPPWVNALVGPDPARRYADHTGVPRGDALPGLWDALADEA